jgi:hypothetical protein
MLLLTFMVCDKAVMENSHRLTPQSRLSAPPAVWTAFAAQGRWKNWVMAGQLVALVALVQVCFALARVSPDVIVVDDTGASRYVERTVSSDALVRFLDTERRRPTDLTLVAFTERFVRLTAGVNSATIQESWTEALSMMALPLAGRISEEAREQKLIETYRLAQIRTTVAINDVQLVERKGDKALVRLVVTRQRTKLFSSDNVGPAETQTVDLVLAEVPRRRHRLRPHAARHDAGPTARLASGRPRVGCRGPLEPLGAATGTTTLRWLQADVDRAGPAAVLVELVPVELARPSRRATSHR